MKSRAEDGALVVVVAHDCCRRNRPPQAVNKMPHPDWPTLGHDPGIMTFGIAQQQRFRFTLDRVPVRLIVAGLTIPPFAVHINPDIDDKHSAFKPHENSNDGLTITTCQRDTVAPNSGSRTTRPKMQAVVRSSASTPSLRSKDGTLPQHLRMDNGGNVRVVVRVRAFLPRGMNRPSVKVASPLPEIMG